MSEVIIKTNGTVEGTSLTADGVDITGTCKCTSISLYAGAPYTSSFDGTRREGMISCSYDCCNDSGCVERKSIFSSETEHEEGIGKTGNMMGEDNVKDKKIIRFIGRTVDTEILALVDKIVSHCETNKLVCPDKTLLLSRSLASLKDKATDLGIVLEDKVQTTEEGK